MAYSFTAASSQYLSSSAPVSGNPMTLVCWAYKAASFGGAFLAIGQSSGSHRNQIWTNGGGAAVAAAGSGSTVQPEAPNNLAANSWHHICGVFTSSTSRSLYQNGNLELTNTTNIGTQNPFETLTVGARINTTVGLFSTSRIAEVGVYNAELTQNEIMSLSKGIKCNKIRPQNLVFYAPLTRTIQDLRNGVSITNNNSATVIESPRLYA